MTEPMVSIPLADLRAVLPFMGSEDMRYYLNGVLVEPYNGGCLLIATNGHIIAVIESKEARCDRSRILALSNEPFLTAIRGDCTPRIDDDGDELPNEDENFDGALWIDNAEARAVVVDESGVERFVLPGTPFIEGKYPDWRKVVPPIEHLKQGVPYALAGQYLALMDHPAINKLRSKGVLFWGDDRGTDEKPSAITVRFDGLPNLIVVVMPISKVNPALSTWPAWMTVNAPEQAASAA